MKRKTKEIEVIYEYNPDRYSREMLNEVYAKLFDEIKILIVQKGGNKSYGNTIREN